jgi:hypothetical protein
VNVTHPGVLSPWGVGMSSDGTVYHPRDPSRSPFWQLLTKHYEGFKKNYSAEFEKRFGFFRRVIEEVVQEYLECGDLSMGFARIRCTNPDCRHEYLLAFSCKGRWFCPSCHAKRVVKFGEDLCSNILYPVPHRQYVFSIPTLLRIFFRHHTDMLTNLCHCAKETLEEVFQTELGLTDGVPSLVMVIHTFGDYAR